ncbi:MAG: redox-sensing transcriptional repressor Rex [Lachnospiraceae bacterium]|jgi:redox-sensing transcriptional repressor|nr:redox-sensing transcriptional repressor Rex [Lachnospiraceae bacterium]
MVNRNYISDAVIRRLPRYYRYLGELLNNNVTRISSGELSRRMGLTASQVRQDLNHFGEFGQQGYGYHVEVLYQEVARILGIDQVHNIIIIGAGHLGQALVNYTNFEKRGFHVTAMFDIAPEIIGQTIGGRTVQSIENLEKYINENVVDIGVLTIPKAEAIHMANLLVECGVKGIWNFASIDLQLADPTVIVENVHLSDSLMRLSYKFSNQN